MPVSAKWYKHIDPSAKLESTHIMERFFVWITRGPVFMQILLRLLIFLSSKLIVAWLKSYYGLFTQAETETAVVGVVQRKGTGSEQWIRARSQSYTKKLYTFF